METPHVLIVASGPSARGLNMNLVPPHVQVVAVNGAYDWLERLDHFFTLDNGELSLPRHKKQKRACQHWAAVPDGRKLPPWFNRLTRLALCGRDGLHPTPEPADKNSPEWWFWRWSATPTLCETRGVIHTGNSVWGALQLAYQWSAKKVVIAGLDGTGEERVSGGRPRNLKHLPMLFRSAMPQLRGRCEVINANPSSRIDCFPRTKWENAVKCFGVKTEVCRDVQG